jgi:hypothetical protein
MNEKFFKVAGEPVGVAGERLDGIQTTPYSIPQTFPGIRN